MSTSITHPTVVVADTETIGFPRKFKPYTDPLGYDSARLVSISWQIFKPKMENGNTVYSLYKSKYHIIKPNGFIIPSNVVKIHNITTAKANKNGKEMLTVLAELHNDLKELMEPKDANILAVAHNMNFDKHIILSEVHRHGFKELEKLLNKLPTYCTMLQSKSITKIRTERYPGFKPPKLKELYNHFFEGESFKEHDALEDVKACAKCYFKMKEITLVL